MDYKELLAKREKNLDLAGDYIGEALNIIQEMSWSRDETEAMKVVLGDLYDRVYDTMLRVRSPISENPDDNIEGL